MKIDVAVAFVVFFFGALGLWSGAIKQTAHLAGLAAGWPLARPLAGMIGPLVAKRVGYPLLITTIGCSFVVFFLLYVATVLILRFVLRKIFPDGEHGWLNRVGGFGLGAAKAALICFVVLSFVVLVENFIGSLWDDFHKETRQSYSLRFARHHSLFASLPAVGGLEKILKAGRDPSQALALASDPEFTALSRDPRVRGMIDDAGIHHALEEGDYAELLSSVKVLDALNDPKMVERLMRLESGSPAPKPAPAPAKPKGPSPPPSH